MNVLLFQIVFFKLCFCLLVCLVKFPWLLHMMHWVKGSHVSVPLGMWWWGVGGGEAFYIPMIRSLPFSVPVCVGSSQGIAQFTLPVSGTVSAWPVATRRRAAQTHMLPMFSTTNKPHQPLFVLGLLEGCSQRGSPFLPPLDNPWLPLASAETLTSCHGVFPIVQSIKAMSFPFGPPCVCFGPPKNNVARPGLELLQYTVPLDCELHMCFSAPLPS